MKRYADKSLQAYFTNASDIRTTMINLLGNTSGKSLLEPCFGEGAFIRNLIGHPTRIDAIDIDESYFNGSMGIDQCYFHNLDFIDYFVNSENRNKELPLSEYDLVICNPPYGLKFSIEYRKLIKQKFPEVYARESYGLFFYLSLKLIREGGKYVFIMPDSFMTSRNLSYIRKFMITMASPTHIIQFKSKRFGSVNFGYGNMCIISGYKKTLREDDNVTWIDATQSNESLDNLLKTHNNVVSGSYLIDGYQDSWIYPSNKMSVSFSRKTTILGEIADCKTGIYTGNNKEFCGYDKLNPPKRVNGHPVDWDSFVFMNPSESEKRVGLGVDIGYVPFIRGGHREPFEDTNSCIRWDKKAILFYNKDKKARLQNKEFYFKKGLAVPMVTSGRLSASEMQNAIFDQGVVGVFPKFNKYHDFLLIYLNHAIASNLKNMISPGANNSANYLKRMPIPKVTDDEIKLASEIVYKAKVNGWNSTLKERNSFIEGLI